MKAYQWVLLAVFGFVALVLVIGASTLFGYYYSMVSVQPEVIVETVLVDNPVEVIVTKEVEVVKTVMVEVTPTPSDVTTQTATPEPLAVFPTEEACEDVAWVVSQPKSDIYTGGLEVGEIKRLRFRIRNEGTCIWDGYTLTSDGAIPDIQVPLTYPGEIADVYYDLRVSRDVVARWVLQPPTTAYGLSSPLMFENSASPGVGLETIYYELDVVPNKVKIPGCGPFGCRSDAWRLK